MRDNGILLLTTFVAIGAGSLGFGIGDSLARYTDIPHALHGPDRLQWEVLLTGLAALAGGFMAYRGATNELRHEIRSIGLRHIAEVGSTMSPFLQIKGDDYETIEDHLKTIAKIHKRDCDTYIIETCEKSRSLLPSIPDKIFNETLFRSHQDMISRLNICQLLGSFNVKSIHELKISILKYIREVEKTIDR